MTEQIECLLCHVVHTESFVGNPSRAWRCNRCRQHWDDARIATVMAYQEWAKTAVPAAHGVAATVTTA